MKQIFNKVTLLLATFCLLLCLSNISVFAGDLDSLTNGSTTGGTSSSGNTSQGNNEGLTGYLKGYTPVSNDNITAANKFATPIVNLIGNAIGFIVVVLAAGIMFVTALDLVYIGIPFLRSYLNPNYDAQGGGGMGMGGMGMGGMGMGGMHGRGMGMGGMGMGGMGGQQGAQEPHRKCWVSDEALQCIVPPQPAQQGGMGGMGMGGMGMGMGGMMGGGQQQQPQSTKSAIMTYFKKRVFFIVVFTVALIMLTSSIFTNSGINLAQLLFKVMDNVNKLIGNASF